MLILPIRTQVLEYGDNLGAMIDVQNGDIVVVSSKAVATIEGNTMEMKSVIPTEEAKKYASQCNQDPRFTERILQETRRMHGSIVGSCPWALLTSLKPDGMERGRILCPNAGLDRSNVKEGCVVGWPVDPLSSVRTLRSELQKDGKHIGVILSDSCCRPGRLGVVAFALTVAGLDPILNQVGEKDLFDHELRFTHEATADQLATAANAVMGNADQATPVAIIRDHGIALNNNACWVEGIVAEEDLFRDVMRK
jgi:coenzyme F420-0:L-glutamate ligase / coenzyme F420-1:gamma-L-glutamate ligase